MFGCNHDLAGIRTHASCGWYAELTLNVADDPDDPEDAHASVALQ
jgi:hypothetical protein